MTTSKACSDNTKPGLFDHFSCNAIVSFWVQLFLVNSHTFQPWRLKLNPWRKHCGGTIFDDWGGRRWVICSDLFFLGICKRRTAKRRWCFLTKMLKSSFIGWIICLSVNFINIHFMCDELWSENILHRPPGCLKNSRCWCWMFATSPTRMSQEMDGSMVSKETTNKWGILGVITHILNLDPNFLGHTSRFFS